MDHVQDQIKEKFDLNKLQNKKQICSVKDSDVNVINKCSCLSRIIYALNYYEMLNAKHSKEGVIIFTECIKDTYKHYLDDIIHLICKHPNDLYAINKELTEKYQYSTCDIKTCALTGRHCYLSKTDHSDDDSYKLIQQIFDGLHYYLFHLFQLGLRSIDNAENEAKEYKDDESNSYYDKEFAVKQQMISVRRNKLTKLFERFENDNNKFNINDNPAPFQREDETVLDGLYIAIKRINGNKIPQVLEHFVLSEEYDSDSISGDVYCKDAHECIDKSNLLKLVKANKNIINCMINYVLTYKMTSTSFSAGFIFLYWPYYKNKVTHKEEKQEAFYNINDYSGYKIDELYIEQPYRSFKDEILNYSSKHMTIDKYNDVVIKKSNEYLQTNKVKKIKSAQDIDQMLHYDIQANSPLSESHIQSVILYCDFSALCTDFSSTFRKLFSSETLKSVKKRNQKYWFWSKYLRETVQYFGITSSKKKYDNTGENGPFYCGMSVVIVMPTFAIRFCGPTSTTKIINVAMNFSGKRGIIIQINNTKWGGGEHERFFNVSWLSKYHEEEERLWMGGRNKLQIQSIRHCKKQRNYHIFFHALYWFDSAVTGSLHDVSEFDMSSTDIYIISKLISYTLGKSNSKLITDNNFDQYVLDTFTSFCVQKKTIVINLYELNRLYPLEFTSLIIDSLGAKNKIENDSDNLILLNVIHKLFPNVSQVMIHSTSTVGDQSFAFSILSLSKCMTSECKYEISAVHKYENYGSKWIRRSWIFDVYSTSNLCSTFSPLAITKSTYDFKQDTINTL